MSFHSFKPSIILLIYACLCGVHPCLWAAEKTDPTLRDVEAFHINDVSPLEAILRLGQQLNIPLGIICSDSALLSAQISVNVSNTNVHSVIASILGSYPSYGASVGPTGVIRISDPSKESQYPLLTFKFPRFRSYQPAQLQAFLNVFGVIFK